MNRKNRRLALCFIVIALLYSVPVYGQGENLLRDPSFEDTSMKVVATELGEGTTFAVNASWNGWYTTSPRNDDWQNRIPNGTGRNNTGDGYVRSGNRSMELSRGYATFTAAVHQTVEIPAGTSVRASAWYVMDISDDSSSQARVGIHPAGGTNPFDSAVVWSSWGGNQSVSAGWRQLSASTTATGTHVTIFLYTTQTVPSERNGIYWDDAELVITQSAPAGSQPAQPTAPSNPPSGDAGEGVAPNPPSTAVTVVPVQANPDGSIVHQVNSGETTSAIARAYGVPMNTILDLNPALGDGSLIRPGQLITIRPSPDSAPPPTARPPVTLTPSPTEVAAVPEFEVPNSATAELCVGLYEDLNRNNLRDVGEPSISGGTLTLEREGLAVDVFQTDNNPDLYCFDILEAGAYTVLASPPPDYTLAGTSSRRLVNIGEGSRLNVSFGAFAGESNPSLQIPTALPEVNADDVIARPANNLRTIGLIIFGLAAVTLVFGGMLALVLGRAS